MVTRCGWAKDPLMAEYHDREWGVPLPDDRRLFEFLTLEGAQAGLSWMTILKKREDYRKTFLDFDYEKVAKFSRTRIERLCGDAGIVNDHEAQCHRRREILDKASSSRPPGR